MERRSNLPFRKGIKPARMHEQYQTRKESDGCWCVPMATLFIGKNEDSNLCPAIQTVHIFRFCNHVVTIEIERTNKQRKKTKEVEMLNQGKKGKENKIKINNKEIIS